MPPKQKPEHTIVNTLAESRSFGLPVAVLLATAALTGCTAGGAAEQQGHIPGQVSPVDQLSQTIYNASAADRALSDYEPDLKQARQVTFKLEKGSIVRRNLEQAIEATAAENVVDGIMHPYDPISATKAKQQAGKIKDPATRQEILEQIDAQTIDQIVTAVNHPYEPMPEPEAVTALSKLPDTPERRAAATLMHTAKAEDILERIGNSYAEVPLSSVQARQEAQAITDPAVAAVALQAVDIKMADTVLSNIILSQSSPAEAINQARAEIVDPVIENDVVQAVGYYDQYQNHYDYDNYDKFSEINNKYDEYGPHGSPLQAAIEQNESVIRDIDTKGYALSNRLDEHAHQRLEAADQAIGALIQEHNGIITDLEPVSIPLLKNPTAVIDLTNANGSKQVTDWYAKHTGEKKAPKLDQFAEVYAENGQAELHFQKESGLKAEDRKLIAEAVERAEPLLEAAMASGDLLTMRFIKSDSYDPYYVAGPREAVMVLPSDASTTVDQLSSGIHHETIHALTRDIDVVGAGITKEQAANIDRACAQLRAISYDSFEFALDYAPEVLAGVRAVAKPEDVVLFDQFSQEIQAGTLDVLMAGVMKSEYSTYFNNCYEIGLGDVLQAVGRKAGIEDAAAKISYLHNTPELQALAEHWVNVNEYSSIYKKLNESNFVETDYEYKDYLGHSQDNTDELIASIVDVAVSYPDKFKASLAEMTDSDRMAAVTALGASLDIIRGQHPTLVNYLNTLQAEVTR